MKLTDVYSDVIFDSTGLYVDFLWVTDETVSELHTYGDNTYDEHEIGTCDACDGVFYRGIFHTIGIYVPNPEDDKRPNLDFISLCPTHDVNFGDDS